MRISSKDVIEDFKVKSSLTGKNTGSSILSIRRQLNKLNSVEITTSNAGIYFTCYKDKEDYVIKLGGTDYVYTSLSNFNVWIGMVVDILNTALYDDSLDDINRLNKFKEYNNE